MINSNHNYYLSKYANDFIILLDENFRFIEVNERVKDFYGYSHKELIGMHASQLRASETKEEFVNQIKVAQLSGKALYETIHQRKDGSTFPVEISLRAIQSEGKKNNWEWCAAAPAISSILSTTSSISPRSKRDNLI